MSGSVEPFIISGMREDFRTSFMPTAAKLGAQSYVGVPVVRSDGTFFGTLCGLDPRAREIPEAAVQFLSVIARLSAYQLERDELLEAQTRARTELERLSGELQRKSQFEQHLIGIVSHDLKNPLTGIMMSAAVLRKQRGIDDATRRSADRLYASAERAARMVHDLLDFSEARHDRIHITPRPANLKEILEQAVEEVQAAKGARQIVLEVEDAVMGRWDPDRLAQVFQNLVDNAVAYGPPDRGVTIRICASATEVTVSVHNHGDPISEEVARQIFEPFVREGERSGSRSVGLGLFIVRHLVEAHGGEVRVTSTASEGTTFAVRLPRYAPVGEEARSPGAEGPAADPPAASESARGAVDGSYSR